MKHIQRILVLWLLLGLGLASAIGQTNPLTINYTARETLAPEAVRVTLSELREMIASRKLSFQVGYTTALERPLSQLTGLKVSEQMLALAEKQTALSPKLQQIDAEAFKKFIELHPQFPTWTVNCSADLDHFDWRSKHKVTPVRDQECGDCWAYATLGAYESSYLIRNFANSVSLDTSEPQIVDCSGAGSCGGGLWAFQYLVDHGTCNQAQYPQPAGGSCVNVTTPYRAVTWGRVDPGNNIASVDAIKKALCQYGALFTAVRATGAFQAYVGGVFDEHDTNGVNHAVTIIGWDDTKKAWLIKNSWGTGWGSNCDDPSSTAGFMWIAYDSNYVGTYTAYVQAQHIYYRLPPEYYKLIPHIRPLPDPERIDPSIIRELERNKLAPGNG
jgi:cathepsin L